MGEDQLWDIRAFVYRYFAETTRPPHMDEVASRFHLTREEAASAYEQLHQHHELYLKPGTLEVLMANPFSGVETPFRVHTNGKTYFANCAWDTLGIPAALHVDAKIEAACAQTKEPVRLSIKDQQAQPSGVLVHFLVPFQAWYDDLTFT